MRTKGFRPSAKDRGGMIKILQMAKRLSARSEDAVELLQKYLQKEYLTVEDMGELCNIAGLLRCNFETPEVDNELMKKIYNSKLR